MVDDAFLEHKDAIAESKYDFQWNKILYGIKETNKWADSKLVMTKMNEKQLQLLGEKPVADGKRKKANKMSTEEKAGLKVNAPKDPEASDTTGKDIMDLIGRDCNIGANSEKIIKEH